MLVRIHCLALAFAAGLLALTPGTSRAAESFDNCTGFIDSLPAVISTQGTWCMRKDLSTGIDSGNAITVATNNVTVDCNDFKLGGLAAGADSLAHGIAAVNRQNVTVRHCKVRGFWAGAYLQGENSGGHVVEDSRFNDNLNTGIFVEGDGSMVRRNLVTDTGGEDPYHGGTLVGIYGIGAVDILDNIVSGVFADADSDGWVAGITLIGSVGGTVQGNRVRGLVSDGTGQPIGIEVYDTVRVTLRSNDIIGSGVGTGMTCTGEFNRARDNVVNGFATPMQECGDAGGNDLVGIP